MWFAAVLIKSNLDEIITLILNPYKDNLEFDNAVHYF